jgi:serine/threonine-protein kinase
VSLSPGTRLGPYEVTAKLGAGGMGEVYRATDTDLGRQVALKVLPDAFAQDAERLARFEREAKTLGALNHPNIAAIYGLEKGDGTRALVMELVEGPTLADRIARGPIPFDEALPIAKQIADALVAAHERGIIHRDLKPANVKVREDGTVKVLDFGLAKAMEPPAPSGDISRSPTITSPAMTQAGVILGTAAYMSPEQARGKPVDKRTDIWAFGCVLYEMLTGKRAFAGDDVTETIAAVVKESPDLNVVPHEVHRLLRKCFEKDPKRRLQDIGDAWEILEEKLPPAVARVSRWQPVLRGAALMLVGVALGYPLWRATPPHDDDSRAVSRFVEALPAGRTIPVGTDDPRRRASVALSPDGRTLVYRAAEGGQFRLYRRFLDESSTTTIGDPGAERPFFSSDGRWVIYCLREASQATLKRVSVRGGPSETVISGICPTENGANWNDDGTIFIGGSPTNGVRLIPANGGDLKTVANRTDGRYIRDPRLLPGGRALLYTVGGGPGNAAVIPSEIHVHELGSNASRKLVEGVTPSYLSSGHLTFVRQDSLWAVPFDLEKLQVRGTPVPVVEGVRVEGWVSAAQVAIADSGTLAYLPGVVRSEYTLVWVDRESREETVGIEARRYQAPRISRDGTLVALPTATEHLWIWNFARKAPVQLTSEPGEHFLAAWFPDDKRLAFSAPAPSRIQWRAIDGSGDGLVLSQPKGFYGPLEFTRDDRLICLIGTSDIGVIAKGGDTCQPLLNTPAAERNATVSPDGRWLAFDSDRTQRTETYVRPFPNVKEAEWTISTEGGCCPVWSRDGRELFYWRDHGDTISIMAVTLLNGPGFAWNRQPRELVRGRYASPSYDTNYDAWRGRFLLLKSTAAPPPNEIVIVENWTEELKRLVPVN